MDTDLMFSSKKDDWRTPQDFFDNLDAEFHFTVDLCADDFNHKCKKYYTKENDGMNADLTGEVVFCNPPYGRKETEKWVKKCASSKCISVMLLPARTDTKIFHECIWKKSEIRFVQGRLNFFDDNSRGDRAPFPSMIVIFRNNDKEA